MKVLGLMNLIHLLIVSRCYLPYNLYYLLGVMSSGGTL